MVLAYVLGAHSIKKLNAATFHRSRKKREVTWEFTILASNPEIVDEISQLRQLRISEYWLVRLQTLHSVHRVAFGMLLGRDPFVSLIWGGRTPPSSWLAYMSRRTLHDWLHFLRSMGDSNLHRLGCPYQSFKKPGPQSQFGERIGISLRKNK